MGGRAVRIAFRNGGARRKLSFRLQLQGVAEYGLAYILVG